MAMSSIRDSMTDDAKEPVNDIKLKKLIMLVQPTRLT